MTKDFKEYQLNESFIGKQADDLGQLISEQIKPLYDSLGIVVPVKSCSIIHALNQVQQASVTEIARSLKQSHQLVKQKLPRLLKLGLISASSDPEDKRKTDYRLTQMGQNQAVLLNKYALNEVYANLSKEVEADLFKVLTAAITSLKNKNLMTRFNEQLHHQKNTEEAHE